MPAPLLSYPFPNTFSHIWAMSVKDLPLFRQLWLYLFATFTLLFAAPQITYTQTLTPDTVIHQRLPFFHPAPKPHPARIVALSSSIAVSYTAAMIGLNKVWYAQYPRGKFHFFDDNAEWNQIDKVGHAWTAYSESLYAIGLYRWAGVSGKKAAWIGGSCGFVFQMGIEVLDGFSEKWGASVGDIIANTAGSALAVSQELLWQEQRVRLKFSSSKVDYRRFPHEVQQRVNQLYGTSFQEKLLKDYNGQSYWLSFSPLLFFPNRETRFPKWLNLAIGYGAEGMLGGFENKWTDDEGNNQDFTHLPRQRQYFLSADINLSQIKTRSKLLNTFLDAVNVLKIPAPAFSINNSGKLKGYWLYW